MGCMNSSKDTNYESLFIKTEIHKLNNPLPIEETEFVVKISIKNTQVSMTSVVNSTKHFKKQNSNSTCLLENRKSKISF